MTPNSYHQITTDIEKQWAVKALHHAETYIKLLKAVEPAKLKLTRYYDLPSRTLIPS